jgi:hypothetical protein
MTDQSPFVPGARVAVYIGDRWTERGYREDFVEKTHRTGRFTLRSNPKQQWSPTKPSGYQNYWSANETGDHGWNGGGTLRIWDDAGDSEIMEANNKFARFNKFRKLKDEMHRIQFSDLVTDELMDQFEIVVLGMKPIPKEKSA